ncbi:hypothetical protein ACFCV3_28315 [Kribbella sp. NPDC056345]|uniref:hypothetical protein n=1 Tax=Kribbella sp. NPDC056345 TaxID=3345789 RepID=UPI0035E0899B
MGDTGPEHWDAEYRRTGRVVFPRRRQSLYSWQMLLSWVIVIGPVFGTVNDWDTRGTWFYIRAVLGLILLAGAISTTAQILRGGPVLIVDTTGLHLGNNFIPWSAVTTIGTPVRSFFNSHLPVHLLDEDGDEDELEIPRDNVDDLPSLAAWLNHLHTERQVS